MAKTMDSVRIPLAHKKYAWSGRILVAAVHLRELKARWTCRGWVSRVATLIRQETLALPPTLPLARPRRRRGRLTLRLPKAGAPAARPTTSTDIIPLPLTCSAAAPAAANAVCIDVVTSQGSLRVARLSARASDMGTTRGSVSHRGRRHPSTGAAGLATLFVAACDVLIANGTNVVVGTRGSASSQGLVQ